MSDLTLDKLILSGAARAKLRALRAADIVLNLCGKNLASQSVVSAAYFVDTVPRSEKKPPGGADEEIPTYDIIELADQ